MRDGGGHGNIDALVTLPVGTQSTFTVSGTVPAETTGPLTNTATVTPPLGVTDPVPGNNGATDNNPAGPQADLTISKVSIRIRTCRAAMLTYTIVVTNNGPIEREQCAGAGRAAGANGGASPGPARRAVRARRAGRRQAAAASSAGDAAGGHQSTFTERDGAGQRQPGP